ncbi:TATA box-binding protein-associated factor RNA polymerase I subunit A [Astyanax mexicanus]|uniref:TATA box-binding protein-associated factor RNA polymerase I subunit A n=2 Tax=Astyanax mexicanus TaxID=7994 RepID=A0A8T2MDS7_ASTMX|nr:TATA box-binding protein-associated factor RNA polymerase I subunit A [Astyanax mexicanus]KAG9282518.1 TATA box-binding protein-associated factor RNA polymerase I subunit A [Astyanax mexicanus]
MDDIEAELGISRSVGNEDFSDSSEDERVARKIRPPILLHSSTAQARAKESGFHESSRLCLKAIRDAMLHHHWQEAAQYLSAYSQTLEDTTVNKQSLACEIIWRLGTEILQHHPNSRLEDFNALYEQMKNSGVKNYAKICLEHSFHLLLNGHIYDAKRQLSVAASWRYGKQSVPQSLDLKLIHAYCGFLDYVIWHMKKSSVSEAEDNSSNREMHSYFRQASVTLQEIIAQPGVWDPFVLSYVDMLEFYNDQEEALKVLQNYAYNKDYPSNPNAHVYLYQFLKRHEAPPAKLISILKVLHHLVPSHELMQEYCYLLVNSVVPGHLEESLPVVFNLLDYPSWKNDLDTWNCLLTVMTVFKRKGLQHLIANEWKQRKDFWLTMHYRAYHGRKDSELNRELLLVKAKVAKLLGEHGIYYNKFSTEVWGPYNVEDKKRKIV